MTRTQYIWNLFFFLLCLFIIEIEMWKKYLVFILDQLLNDCVIPAAEDMYVVLDLLHMFWFFYTTLFLVKLQMSPGYSLFAVETKSIHVLDSVTGTIT